MKLQPSDVRYIHECRIEANILKRKLKDLTCQAIADRLGVNKSAVQKTMAGKLHKKQMRELNNTSL